MGTIVFLILVESKDSCEFCNALVYSFNLPSLKLAGEEIDNLVAGPELIRSSLAAFLFFHLCRELDVYSKLAAYY